MTVELKSGEEITGSARVLNYLALTLCTASIKYGESGLALMSQEANDSAFMIYDALDESGYYDEYKGV